MEQSRECSQSQQVRAAGLGEQPSQVFSVGDGALFDSRQQLTHQKLHRVVNMCLGFKPQRSQHLGLDLFEHSAQTLAQQRRCVSRREELVVFLCEETSVLLLFLLDDSFDVFENHLDLQFGVFRRREEQVRPGRRVHVRRRGIGLKRRL
jgi:hypothetical protein